MATKRAHTALSNSAGRSGLGTAYCAAFQLVTFCFIATIPHGDNVAVQAQELSVQSFRYSSLLDRFDKNLDGRLDENERIAMREAFGGVDVPLLPDRPYDYVSCHVPEHFDTAQLELADNTPADNSLTDSGAALGRVLFYDVQLSINNRISCSSCHRQEVAFTDPRQFSGGFAGGHTVRNAMSLTMLRYSNLRGARPGFFWDERAPTLEAQALMPIQDPVEMGMDLRLLEAKLQSLPYYPPLFEAAFGSRPVTSDRVAKALAQFVRSMLSTDSKFDRAATKRAQSIRDHSSAAKYSADFDDFTAQENYGKALFINGIGEVAEIGCAHCHLPPTFGMPKSFNNGLDLHYKDAGLGALARPPNDAFTPSNDGKFKAPSLRNVERTAPYMHDGRFKTLDEVVEHYSSGVHPHENVGLALDRGGGATTGFQFSTEQKAALVAFLKTLTDETFLHDPRFADPFMRPSSSEGESAVAADDDEPAVRYQRLLDEYEAGAEPRELAAGFLELAEHAPGDPVAVDALVWILTKLRNRPESTRALQLLAQNHLQCERIAAACPQIARTPSIASEKLLRGILDKNPYHEVQAQACYHLGLLLDQQASVVQQLKNEPASANRILQYYGKEYGKHIASLDQNKLDQSREEVYERLMKSFAEVKNRDTTMGEVAERTLFQLRHLSIGRAAPDIVGEDIFGETFKLSDYRGKVVLLSFWGDW